MIKLYKVMKMRFLFRHGDKYETAPGLLASNGRSESFISDCLQVLENTTPGTAIYILSCLCPESMDVILGLIRLDLSRPHRHPYPSKKPVNAWSGSYEEAISHLRNYGSLLPEKVYGRLWLEVAHHWLLTCPFDEKYYKSDEDGNDMFCQKLRSDLIDRILKID